eukprot:15352447-Ditylum_brightwellii.AAC.1
MQADFDCCIANIITTVNVNSKKAAFNTSQNISSASSTSFKVYKRHMDDQKKLPGGLFESSKQLQIFKNNFKTAMHGQSHWKQILHIMTKSGIKFILTDFMLIDEADLKGAHTKRSPEESTATKTCILHFGSHLLIPSRPQCKLLPMTMRQMVQLYCTIFFVNIPARQSQS